MALSGTWLRLFMFNQDCTKVWITDKTGKKFFNTLCGTAYADSEIRNLSRKLTEARKYPEAYKFLDLDKIGRAHV